MIYLDSNVFIFALLYDQEVMQEAKNSRTVLHSIIQQKEQACTSSLTWDEVVYIIRKKAGVPESICAGEKMFRFPHLPMIPVDREIVSTAQRLIGRYSIRPRDAIHAASAIVTRCESILSEDSDFEKIDEIRRVSLSEYVKLHTYTD